MFLCGTVGSCALLQYVDTALHAHLLQALAIVSGMTDKTALEALVTALLKNRKPGEAITRDDLPTTYCARGQPDVFYEMLTEYSLVIDALGEAAK